jgi:hypothetical protein
MVDVVADRSVLDVATRTLQAQGDDGGVALDVGESAVMERSEHGDCFN